MDFLPIQPGSTNKVNTTINLSNDGGSKSNTGYFSQRGAKEAPAPEQKLDEVKLSTTSTSSEEIEVVEVNISGFIKKILKAITDFLTKLFSKKNEELEIENIYEHSSIEENP
jgi:hypothetical protein